MLYSYKCENKHVVEHKFGMSEERPSEIPCPECGEISKRYLGSMPAVRYEGTGFASTDIPRKSGLEGYTS